MNNMAVNSEDRLSWPWRTHSVSIDSGGTLHGTIAAEGRPGTRPVSGGVASKPIQHVREINGCIALFLHLGIESHACGSQTLI